MKHRLRRTNAFSQKFDPNRDPRKSIEWHWDCLYLLVINDTTSLDIPVKTLLTRIGVPRGPSESGGESTGLSSLLSHELRTPLTSIIGFAELLLKNPAMDHARRNEYLQYIHDEGMRLNDLVATIISEMVAAERSQSRG